MGMNLSNILPSDIKATIPVTTTNKLGEIVMDSITVFTPTIKSVEEYRKESCNVSTDMGSILLLIKHFTDINNDIDEEKLSSFSIYYDDVWNALQDELFDITKTINNVGK
jgi:hypothetical protein